VYSALCKICWAKLHIRKTDNNVEGATKKPATENHEQTKPIALLVQHAMTATCGLTESTTTY